jgi:hypothetical protein
VDWSGVDAEVRLVGVATATWRRGWSESRRVASGGDFGGALGLDAIHHFDLNPIMGPVTRYRFGHAHSHTRVRSPPWSVHWSPGVWLGPGDGPIGDE